MVSTSVSGSGPFRVEERRYYDRLPGAAFRVAWVLAFPDKGAAQAAFDAALQSHAYGGPTRLLLFGPDRKGMQ